MRLFVMDDQPIRGLFFQDGRGFVVAGGLFAEFFLILFFAICVSAVAFLLLVAPIQFWNRRTNGGITPTARFIAGLVLGCAAMMGFTALTGWPMRAAELVAGSIAGAVGVEVYARLVFKRGSGESV